jgi:hypothetical protein
MKVSYNNLLDVRVIHKLLDENTRTEQHKANIRI